MPKIKWSAFPSTASAAASGDTLVGLHNGANYQFNISASPTGLAISQWDVNKNLYANNLHLNQTISAAGGTVTLTAASSRAQIINGTGATTVILPNATTLTAGWLFFIINNSNSDITVVANDGVTQILVIRDNQNAQVLAYNVSTTNGLWNFNYFVPGSMSNGQILIGGGTNGPKTSTLTAGTGMSITNASGSITLSTTGGGLASHSISGQSHAAVINTRYLAFNANQTTLNLPSTFAVGDVIEMVGTTTNTGGWVIQASAGHTIRVNNSTTTAGGTVTSSAVAGQTISLVCDVANTSWIMLYTSSVILTTA